MDGRLVISGIVCLILAGLTGVDVVSTTINTDGSAMMTTAGSDENGSFASRAMVLDDARISRTVSSDEEMVSGMVLRSRGPALLTDYAESMMRSLNPGAACAFLEKPGDHVVQKSSLSVSGIVHDGEIDASRTIDSGLSGMTTVNGSGLLLFGSQSDGNRSLVSRGFVTGNMSVADLVRYGGKL